MPLHSSLGNRVRLHQIERERERERIAQFYSSEVEIQEQGQKEPRGPPQQACDWLQWDVLDHSLLHALWQQKGVARPGVWGRSIFWDSLPGQVAPAAGLEPYDDVSDLQVPLLLQVGKHTSAEEDFAQADAVQVAVELQGFDLGGRIILLDCWIRR